MKRPSEMKMAMQYCLVVGLYTPRNAPIRIIGMTLALFAKTTNGKLTNFNAKVLAFIDPNWKSPTRMSPLVNCLNILPNTVWSLDGVDVTIKIMDAMRTAMVY